MRRYRHVAFDFDGVLCDSLPAAMAVFNELGEESFPALPRVACQDDMVEVYGGSLRTALSAWLDETEHRRFFDLHSAAMAERAGELHAFEGVEEMLDELPPGSASIITSAYSTAVHRVLLGEGGDELPPSLFEILGRERGQTKTEKLRELVGRLGISPRECLYVGDLESDVIYCRALPMDIVAVTYGYHPRRHLEGTGPTWLVDSVGELRRLIGEALDQRPVAA